MEYLIKLIMPPKDGLLLDPFAGSGTTVLAAHKLGLKCIGIEKSQEYCDIANARVAHYIQNNLMFG
jgi:site-specific DNA-methyltransferase (adenine-specific)